MRDAPLILLVDDEDVFLEIASTKLAGAGFAVEMAHNVDEGFEKALALLPDLVLSDIYMGETRGGWDLAIELHSNERTRNIKFVFFTSLRDPWAELTGEKREVILEKLGKPMFLSKIDDVAVLGNKISEMVAGRIG